jgi:uncharacterized RDD family membrane protein YckC
VGFGLKNMGSAQLNTLGFEEEAATGTEHAVPLAVPLDLKQQAAERIRLHRERRNRPKLIEETPSDEPVRQRHNPIAAAVAERYAQTPSYRAFLAEEAQRAMDKARRDAENAAAEAEVAARNAEAVAHAQQQLLAELELWNAPQEFTPATAEVTVKPEVEAAPRKAQAAPEARKARAAQPGPAPASALVPVKEVSTAGLTVRLYEDIGARPRVADLAKPKNPPDAKDAEEALALDEEILFRQAPVFEPFDVDPPMPLPANLLEFPRQLIAARKARPRLAEGPLLEEEPRSPQLRIFEVEPEQISITPATPSVTPEWANIHLDAQPATKPEDGGAQAAAQNATSTTPLLASMLSPQTAPLELRLMATAVDLIMVGFAFTLFVGTTAHFAHRLPVGIPGAIAAGITFAVLYPLYELLFFTFSDQTPGMRYARIGLCTLSDENPSRAAIRKRILAQLVALCPFGLGILWALLDEDGLGWHDRISRMYQRAY